MVRWISPLKISSECIVLPPCIGQPVADALKLPRSALHLGVKRGGESNMSKHPGVQEVLHSNDGAPHVSFSMPREVSPDGVVQSRSTVETQQ